MRTPLCLLISAQLWICAAWAETPAAFGLTNIWTIELHTTPQGWTTLTSSRTFIRAEVRINGQTYTDVQVREKGGGTSGGAGQGRPPLRLVFKGQRVAGAKRLSLNNNYFDTSYLRDVLSYKLCNDFGVAAPKTAFAKVYLRTSETGPLRYIGLYTATEIVDETFLQERFRSNGGLLMKPRATFAGSRNWNELEGWAAPKRSATEAEQARMLAFTKLFNEGSDAAFAREIESYIDLDNYLRFVAVNVALANLDSYLAMGKNYYLYLGSASGKLTWIPWDFDLSFGGFFLCGTPKQRVHLSLDRPSTVNDRLIERLLALPHVKQRYHMLLREFLEKHFQVGVIERQIDELAKLIEPAVMEEKLDERRASFKQNLGNGGNSGQSGGWAIDIGLKQFIEGRASSINEQLMGRSKGERPGFDIRR